MQIEKIEDKVSRSLNSKLTAVGVHEHVAIIFKNHWKRLISSFSAFFFPLISFAEIFNYTPDQLTDLQFNLLILGFSAIASVIYTVHHYINLSPKGFEDESEEIRKIAHLQRPKWEYKLAKKLMENRLSKIDNELKDLIDGKKYIGIAKRPDIYEYWEWINVRIENLKRMLDPMLQLLIAELPDSLRGNKDKPADTLKILQTIEKIETLYKQTYEFELEGHRIDPPAKFRTVHKYQSGWTHVFRDAINQMFSFVDSVIEHDFKKEENAFVDFEIKVGAPKNLDKFSKELDRIEL